MVYFDIPKPLNFNMTKALTLLVSGMLLLKSLSGQTLQTVTDNGSTTTNKIVISPTIIPAGVGTVAPALQLSPDYRVSGPVVTVPAFTATGASTIPHPNIACSGGSGTGLIVDVTVAASGAATARVINGGTGYVAGDVLTISKASIGGPASGDYTLFVGSVSATNNFGSTNAPLSITNYTQGNSVKGAFTPMWTVRSNTRNGVVEGGAMSFGFYWNTAQNPAWAFINPSGTTYMIGMGLNGTVDIPVLSSANGTIASAKTASITNTNGAVVNTGISNIGFLDNAIKYYGSVPTIGYSFLSNTTVINGAVGGLTITNGGSGYAPGQYANVPASGGSGTGLYISVVVDNSGQVTSATVGGSTELRGTNYLDGDVVTASIQGGTGFSAKVVLRTNNSFAALSNTSTYRSSTADNFYTVKSTPAIAQKAGATGNLYGFYHDPKVDSLVGKNIAFQNVTGDVYMGTTSGNVGIGTIAPKEKLSVKGTILAQKVRVSASAADWPDYVFHKSYSLMPLPQVEAYIQQHQHLPEVPSATTVEDKGLDLGNNQAVLLKKIEELTLYIIEQNKKLTEQQRMLEEQNTRINKLETVKKK